MEHSAHGNQDKSLKLKTIWDHCGPDDKAEEQCLDNASGQVRREVQLRKSKVVLIDGAPQPLQSPAEETQHLQALRLWPVAVLARRSPTQLSEKAWYM